MSYSTTGGSNFIARVDVFLQADVCAAVSGFSYEVD